MDYIRINRLSEEDFDAVVKEAGGCRLEARQPASGYYNADYILNEAIIELKLLDEEGLVKEKRRKKIGRLFTETQPGRAVVVLDPHLLSQSALRRYYNLLRRPIQTAVKKAAKQLDETRARLGKDSVRVLVILNNGYTALNMDEFPELVGKSVRHDTSRIDYAVSGGIYYYSDRFDNYFFPRFDLVPVNVSKPFPSYDTLLGSWNRWVENYMTALVRGQKQFDNHRLPVVDLRYEVDGVVYVKPAPPIGKPSGFWPGGKRPRENTTGIEHCPPVATCFPKLDKLNWIKFKEALPTESRLQTDYSSWVKWAETQKRRGGTKLQPFVEIDVAFEDCVAWCKEAGRGLSLSSMCLFATTLVETKIRSIMDAAIDKSRCSIVAPRYIHLITEEIGQDRANDVSSIFYVSELPGLECEIPLMANEKMFFEYALAVAAAYAVLMAIETVLYERVGKYAWT